MKGRSPGLDPAANRTSARRRWRMRMITAIAASYALDELVLLLYASVGATTFRVPLLYALVGGLMLAAQLAVYRSPLAQASADPFLTIWFIVPSVVVQLAFVAIAPEVGFVFLNVLFIVFGFGALRLKAREAAITWGMTALGVVVALPFFRGMLVIPVSTPAQRWITGISFLLTLGRCAVTGVYGSLFREHLAERTGALRRLTATLETQVADRTRELATANQELERLVAARTDEIKILRGVLPICSHCKKIRDDRGAWNQLEAYITDHADVMFTHGICADCLRTHYPGFGRPPE